MWIVIKAIFGGIPPKAYLTIICVLIALGALLWFRHQILVSCETAQQAKSATEKNEQFEAIIKTSTDTKKGREKTDDEVNKMPLSDVDRLLSANGWLRRT